MKRIALLSLCAAALSACGDDAATTAPAAPRQLLSSTAAYLEPALARQLSSAAATDRIEVIVNFDESRVASATFAGLVSGTGAGVLRFRHLSMVAALATPAQVSAIAALPGVQGVYDNGRDELLMVESRASIRADEAYASGWTGAGVGIAIIDSGVNGLHPDLEFGTKTKANLKFSAPLEELYVVEGTPRMGGDVYAEDVPNTDLSSGHGTHVAGTAAGSGASADGYRGVAPRAHLVGLSVGEGSVVVNVSVLQAVDWLLEHGDEHNVQVVNNSWGTTGAFDPNEPLNEAMKRLHDAGITVVFAAGNEGPGENTLNPRSVAPWTIGVAAGCKLYVVDPTNSSSQCQDAGGRGAFLAGFSSRGVPGDPLYAPDVTAPGVRIAATRSYTGTMMNALDASSDARLCNIGVQNLKDYTCSSGTSMAAPHVAGVAALMEQATGGRITPDQTLSILRSTARPLMGYAEWEVGAGYVDAMAAIKAARALRF